MSTISVLQARVSQLKIEGIEWVERALRPARESVSNQPAGASTTDVVRVAQGDDLSRITASQPSTPQLSLYSSPSSPRALRARPGSFADLLGIDGTDIAWAINGLGLSAILWGVANRWLYLLVEEHAALEQKQREKIAEVDPSDLAMLKEEISALRSLRDQVGRERIRAEGWDIDAMRGELSRLRAAVASGRGLVLQLLTTIDATLGKPEHESMYRRALAQLQGVHTRMITRSAEMAEIELELMRAETVQEGGAAPAGASGNVDSLTIVEENIARLLDPLVVRRAELIQRRGVQIEAGTSCAETTLELVKLDAQIEQLSSLADQVRRERVRGDGWNTDLMKVELNRLLAEEASLKTQIADTAKEIANLRKDTSPRSRWRLEKAWIELKGYQGRQDAIAKEIDQLDAELAEAEAKQNVGHDDDNEPPTAGAGGGSAAGGPAAVTVVGTSNSFEALEAQVSNAEVAAALRAEAEAQSVANPLPFAFTRGMAVPSPVELNVLGIRFSLTPARPVPGRVRLVPL